MSPPSYPTTWLRRRSARFRFARPDSLYPLSRGPVFGLPVIRPKTRKLVASARLNALPRSLLSQAVR